MSPYQILIVGVAGAAGVQAAGLREGGAGHLQPACTRHRTLEFDSTVNYPLDRHEVATTDADRAQNTPWNTYAAAGASGHPDLLAGAAGAGGGRAARAGRLAVLRHHRHAGHHAVHPRLPAAPGEHRTGQAQRCPRLGSRRPAAVPGSPRKAAVLGSPIAHSRSPQLHLAAYRALGLDDWTYDRIECTADELPGLVAGFGPEWVGVSVTMPGKFAALRFADERTARAELVGSANTLVRTQSGWRADNTDIDGVTGALGPVVGPGGRARLGRHRARRRRRAGRARRAATSRCVARNREKAAPAAWRSERRLGVDDPLDRARRRRWRTSTWWSAPSPPTWPPGTPTRSRRRRCCSTRSTTRGRRRWRRPSSAAGGRVISGLQMLLHQAFAQVEQFTGLPAPNEAMRAALAEQ